MIRNFRMSAFVYPPPLAVVALSYTIILNIDKGCKLVNVFKWRQGGNMKPLFI